ncbi:MAG: mechanosensitive ion channel family protein [Spirochaetales bacterium]|nr:mechanosensitive ion channel family protein [Spirochaetales bacterium]
MPNLSFKPVLDIMEKFPYEKLFEILLILAIGWIILRIIRILVLRVAMKNSAIQNRMLIGKMINYTGFGILFVVVLAELGIKLSALLGAAGIVGIAVGVASQKSLGNIISGFFMVAEKSFEIGDVIKVGDKTGVVYSVELLSIMLKTFDNLMIRIPHETLISSDVINITRFPIRRMDLFISVSYNEDLDTVMHELEETYRKNIYCLDEPKPFLLVKDFQDSGVLIQFGVWFEKNDYVMIRNTIMSDVLKAFKRAGISIPYPHVRIVTDPQGQSPDNLSGEKV